MHFRKSCAQLFHRSEHKYCWKCNRTHRSLQSDVLHAGTPTAESDEVSNRVLIFVNPALVWFANSPCSLRRPFANCRKRSITYTNYKLLKLATILRIPETYKLIFMCCLCKGLLWAIVSAGLLTFQSSSFTGSRVARSARRKNWTLLTYFQVPCGNQKLRVWTCIHMYISVSGSSWNLEPDKSLQNRTVQFKTGHLATLTGSFVIAIIVSEQVKINK